LVFKEEGVNYEYIYGFIKKGIDLIG